MPQTIPKHRCLNPEGRYPQPCENSRGHRGTSGWRPGSARVTDLDAGNDSVEALLVSIGAPRLRSLGVDLPATIASPEHKLYEVLAREGGDSAHSRYNALIRRLVSFERAAACAS